MDKRQQIEKRVEQTLDSLDGIRRAEPTPFLYTRVRARLEREQKNAWEKLASILARPVVAFASLFVIIGINAFILFNDAPPAGSVNGTAASTNNGNAVVEDYFILAANNYDYENLEP
jgi:hypothetical protein